MDIEIYAFDPENITAVEIQALNILLNRRQAEELPDDPPIPLEDTRRMWSYIPPVLKLRAWLARNAVGEAVGTAVLEMIEMEENRHLAQGGIYVHPDWRRQGIGSRLLAEVARHAQANGRRVFISDTTDQIPAGAEFARKVGAEVGLATHINQLAIMDVDHALMQAWLKRGIEQSGSAFEMVFWDGAYPEDEIQNIVPMIAAMNQAPSGELDVQDIQWTPDLLRQMEESLWARNRGRWTLAVREKATGNWAGYTEIMWIPSKEMIGYQGATGVLEIYRNHGLGRWLKAAMLLKVMEERPQVKFIRTGNADENAPMLKINREMGFQPYVASSICQVQIDQLLERLGS